MPPSVYWLSGGKAFATAGIKQMSTRRIGSEVNGFTGSEGVPLAKHAGDFDARDLAEDLRIGPRGFHDDDFSGDASAVIGQLNVFGP